MPLNIDPYDLGRLKETVENLPISVKSARVVLYEDSDLVFTVKYDEVVGVHRIIWREPK